jgi:hypothetical protein
MDRTRPPGAKLFSMGFTGKSSGYNGLELIA